MRPAIIEAEQFDGTAEMAHHLGLVIMWRDHRVATWGIETSEGMLRVMPGDWIITGVTGERYPCKPDIFAATYEEAI